LPEDTGKIINGGPMMGKALKDASVPVTKGTSGILLIPKQKSTRRDVQPCIRCSKCIEVCPMGLEPYLLMNLSEKVLFDRAKEEDILNCIECGSCSYICPSSRPLLDYIRMGKSAVNNLMKSKNNGK
jgi:electron transport complex protein RnfC